MATGVLGWPPPVFWHATPHELQAAIDAYADANTPKKRTPGGRPVI